MKKFEELAQITIASVGWRDAALDWRAPFLPKSLNVLGLLVDLEPRQADLLQRVVDGPLIPASKLKP